MNGFFLRVLVHPADISDTEGAEWLLAAHHQSFPRIHEIRVEEGYKQRLDAWMEKNTAIRQQFSLCSVFPEYSFIPRHY